MRRTSIGFAAVAILVLALALGYFISLPQRSIGHAERSYLQTLPGMSKPEVVELMSGSSRYRHQHPRPGDFRVWWDDKLLGDSETQPASVEMYVIETFFLPVSFGFMFDAENRLIGRHRFD